MTKGREPAALVDSRLDERIVERALESAPAGPPTERIRNAVESAIDIANAHPDAALTALLALRGNPAALERLEGRLKMSPERATLAVGGAIQIVVAELSSATPNLQARTDELLRWLEGDW
jgi:hypothetical protein